MTINSYCRNNGWLFEDLQGHFRNRGLRASETPDVSADGWICIRTEEWRSSPDLSRTIVQVHDMYDYDTKDIQRAAEVIFTHPMQLWHWKRRGYSGRGTVIPIGARSGIVRPMSCPARPTIGFFCGETSAMEKQSDLFYDVVVAARKLFDFDVRMIGRNLAHIADLGVWSDRAADCDDYQHIDALFTASISPAIPLSVYEACAIGIPIISTPRWFPTADWPNIFFASNVTTLRDHLVSILANRTELFGKREMQQFCPFRLDDWIEYQVRYLSAYSARSDQVETAAKSRQFRQRPDILGVTRLRRLVRALKSRLD